ncbi:hypothetical protein niasHT_012280 [Heterodera trifolii]|uniref:MULE transposase domain-containing protein n=1 Tax=Heterodera trifolii TaxID=157864 RepID=A0ABD2LDW0_9BILA
MNQQQQIKRKRNKVKLEHDGALYVFDQFSADGLKKFWRCEFHGPADKCKGIYADGTFALTPPLFSQIYVLLAKRDGWVFPICYCLLTSKCTGIYTRMLQLLLERWPNFAPQTISLDFESAMVGAVRTVLPACSVRFLDNYTGKPWFNGAMTVPLFEPHEWSVHQRTLDGADRTNNFAEAFHRKLQRQFNCTHSTIWRFIDTIRCVQKTIDAEISHCVMGEAAPLKKMKYRNADARRKQALTRKRTPRENGHAKTYPSHAKTYPTRKRPRENVLAPMILQSGSFSYGQFRTAVFVRPFSTQGNDALVEYDRRFIDILRVNLELVRDFVFVFLKLAEKKMDILLTSSEKQKAKKNEHLSMYN